MMAGSINFNRYTALFVYTESTLLAYLYCTHILNLSYWIAINVLFRLFIHADMNCIYIVMEL